MISSPEDPPRTDADERPIAAPRVPPDELGEDPDEREPAPVSPLKLEGTDRAEDERPADPDDEDDWPYGEQEAGEPGERDDPYAPGLGVLGVSDPAEPNEPG
jgi:hypothetical protein